MRTNNRKVKNTIISIYFILIVLAIVITTLYSSFNEESRNPAMTILIIVGVFILLFVITHNVSKYFEYDSDGTKVVITNRGLLVSDYVNYRQHRIEFDKARLLEYKFRNYIIYKTLALTLKNNQGRKHIERFNVTLVSRRKRRYIRQSLSKIVKQNKQYIKRHK